MPRMIELVRQNAVPEPDLRSAAQGAGALPAGEKLEVLVFLTTHPQLGATARATVAQWTSEQLRQVFADAKTPKEVLYYFLKPANRRPDLTTTIIMHPIVPDSTVAVIAETASRELLNQLLKQERVLKSPDILMGVAANSLLEPEERSSLKERLQQLGKELADTGTTFDFDCAVWILEHTAEIAAEGAKQLELSDLTEEEKQEAAAAAEAPEEEQEKLSVLQKLARMTVAQRVQCAFKGTKEERFILIRDGSKVVSSAVLESPKVSEAEVETFAAMKNVQESVLRTIAMKRRFMKNYSVVKNLANNPRCPLDLSLTLMNHLMPVDLKSLSMNKNVPDTLRKVALKKFKEKSENR